jgi:hypothetical protein
MMSTCAQSETDSAFGLVGAVATGSLLIVTDGFELGRTYTVTEEIESGILITRGQELVLRNPVVASGPARPLFTAPVSILFEDEQRFIDREGREFRSERGVGDQALRTTALIGQDGPRALAVRPFGEGYIVTAAAVIKEGRILVDREALDSNEVLGRASALRSRHAEQRNQPNRSHQEVLTPIPRVAPPAEPDADRDRREPPSHLLSPTP